MLLPRVHRSYTKPVPREDGVFVAGLREFSFSCNVRGLNGVTGALKPILGGDNAAIKQPMAEYVKNSAPWGLKVRLSDAFAQLPPGRTRLTSEEGDAAQGGEAGEGWAAGGGWGCAAHG